MAPRKRAALICFKVKRVQSRFVSVDPSVAPTLLAPEEGRVGPAALVFKAKNICGKKRGMWRLLLRLLAALTNAAQCVKGVLILEPPVTTWRTLTRVPVLSCHVRYCAASSVGAQQLNSPVKVISALVIIVLLQKGHHNLLTCLNEVPATFDINYVHPVSVLG